MNQEWIKEEAENMLRELLSNKLEVSLSGPIDQTGRKLRVINNQNPEWYQKLFIQHWNGKKGIKSRNDIRRHRLIKALENISKGVFRNSLHNNIALEEIKSRIEEGYEHEGQYVPPRSEWGF